MSLLLRCILRLEPPHENRHISTPLLSVFFFASNMDFLMGPVWGGGQQLVSTVVEKVCEQPLQGWLWLCRVLKVCDRGLFLTGRTKDKNQFIGQPTTVQAVQFLRQANPLGFPQWSSRRFVLRPFLDLWSVDVSSPGAPTAVELAKLRELLGTEQGAALAMAANCTVEAGTAGFGGAFTTWSKLVFNWALPWVPGSPPPELVRTRGL